jgi:hypothetical protein
MALFSKRPTEDRNEKPVRDELLHCCVISERWLFGLCSESVLVLLVIIMVAA